MVTHVHSNLLSGEKYNNGKFLSPLKDMNEKTVLKESAEADRVNNSFRTNGRYEDEIDKYYATTDIGSLLFQEESYLEGKLNGNDDVDYYTLDYSQKKFYSKMGISAQLTISLDDIPEGCDYDLVVYDIYGNQIGMGIPDENGNKQVTIPNWDGVTSQYIIKVETKEGQPADPESTYKLKVTEEKSREKDQAIQHGEEMKAAESAEEAKNISSEYEKKYVNEVNDLHKEQYEALPEDLKYTGSQSLEELLEKLASGDRLTQQEEQYIKIFSNLADYEKAKASGKIKTDLTADIQKICEEIGIDYEKAKIEITIDAKGNLTVSGNLDADMIQKLQEKMEGTMKDNMQAYYMQASDISSESYRYITSYQEVSRFIDKSTNGNFSFKDVLIDSNGKISGLPMELCKLLNAPKGNAKYETLQEEIYQLYDYARNNENGMESLENFSIQYEMENGKINRKDVPKENKTEAIGKGYYENLTPIR